MKALFLTRLYYPHVGGVEKHVRKLTEELKKKKVKNEKIEAKILTTKFRDDLKDVEIINRIPVIRFKQPKIKFLGIIYTWYWILNNLSLFKESDIIHIHDVFIWYLPFRFIMPKKHVYMTFHGQWGKYPQSFNDIVQKKIAAILSKGNICIGEYILKNYGIKGDIISYGAVDRVGKTSKKDKHSMLYVGRLDEELPVDIYFKVFGELKDYKIDILGDGKLLKDANLCGEVHGWADPRKFYKKANYVFASGYLTILEALANKCLIFVAYKTPLQKDYYELTPFSKFIVIAKDENELLEKFKYYEKHQKKAKKKVNTGYKWAKQQSWNKLADDYLDLWKIK